MEQKVDKQNKKNIKCNTQTEKSNIEKILEAQYLREKKLIEEFLLIQENKSVREFMVKYKKNNNKDFF